LNGDSSERLTDAANEAEAAVITGFLAGRGITATYQPGASPLGGIFPSAGSGRYEIFVPADELEAAEEALAEADRGEDALE
jgi:hypothetical protein